MASFQQRIIETIISDLEKIQNLESGKEKRNECNLLLKRIESAKKFFLSDNVASSILIENEKIIKALKAE